MTFSKWALLLGLIGTGVAFQNCGSGAFSVSGFSPADSSSKSDSAPTPPPSTIPTPTPVVSIPATISSSIPANVTRALKQGGVNLVFDWYDVNGFNATGLDSELPLIAAAGGAHVRLVISMDVLEDGQSGNLRADRFQALQQFVAKARAANLVTIIDSHNTGLFGDNGAWSDDFMGRLRTAAVRQRHISLMTQLARAASTGLDLNWVILQPANEPIYQDNPSIWYNHQSQLIPAMRQACTNCVLFVMAHEWQGIIASMNNLQRSQMPWFDSRMILDMHAYRPVPLSHCAYTPTSPNNCPGKTWPGYYEDYLPVSGGLFKGTWNRALLESEFLKVKNWLDQQKIPAHFSELGTTASLDETTRAAYINDMTSILRAHGLGWTCYEWHRNWGIKSFPKVVSACFRP